jgi:biotin transport system substrate-specific component
MQLHSIGDVQNVATSTRTISDLVFPRPQRLGLAVLRDAGLIIGGSVVVAALAQLSDHQLPVPHTGQTLGVLLVGAALGWRRGGRALLTYVAAGLAGLPFFANGNAGLGVLVGPTGGYLIGFIAAAMLVGWLAERGWDRSPWLMALAMVLGNAIIYLCGVGQLLVVVHGLTLMQAFQVGVLPFLIFDAIKLIVAVIVLPGAWWIAGRGSRQRQR